MNESFPSVLKNYTPREIVSELDRYIIGQADAKRAVAIALRNRWRRLKADSEMRDEITPKNIILIGPTGVGKTEIARRLAKLASAPFYKVEASKFTEVGYVGKDVESMIRDLTEIAVSMVREEEKERVKVKAEELAEERLLDLLLPRVQAKPGASLGMPFVETSDFSQEEKEGADTVPSENESREKMRQMLRAGKLNQRKVDIETAPRQGPMSGHMPMIEVISSGGSPDDLAGNIRDMIGGLFQGGGKCKKKVTVPEALEILTAEEAARLIDMEQVNKLAIERVENNGILFIDEIDKIASRENSASGPQVSREGVQRDILPIVEGSTVSTKYGFVRTDHILFIAAGAFHMAKPSDLIPELQGRFPIRVELKSLTKEDFLRILREPKNSLIKQYTALMQTEAVNLEFTDDALEEIASMTARLNEQMENIGARRLHTILEKVMEDLSFSASDGAVKDQKIDATYVRSKLTEISQDQDLRKYIL